MSILTLARILWNWAAITGSLPKGKVKTAILIWPTIPTGVLPYLPCAIWHICAFPGWNVIGGGEPEIPGISIGHNEYGAWGLTVFRTDGEDLLQYELNPKNPLQYKHNKTWKDFKVITETIAVKGQADHEVTLYYSQITTSHLSQQSQRHCLCCAV